MKTSSTTLNLVEELVDGITAGTSRYRAEDARGRWVDARIVIDAPATEYTFSKGKDGVWRFTYVNIYGNVTHVHGEGCDACGYCIPGYIAQGLDSFLPSFQDA